MTTTPSLPDSIQGFAQAVLFLGRSLTEAEEIQWTPAPVPKPREDTTQRASGGHGDPTLATVLDDRRLEVRASVDEALATIQDAAERAIIARRRLDEAIAAWNGSTP